MDGHIICQCSGKPDDGYDGSSADSLLSVQRSSSRVCNDRVLGVLTTFSSFALDAYNFFQRGEMLAGGIYLLSSVCLSLAGFYVGLVIVRLIAGQG